MSYWRRLTATDPIWLSLAAYLGLYWLARHSVVSLAWLPGLFLIFYLPTRNLTKAIKPLDKLLQPQYFYYGFFLAVAGWTLLLFLTGIVQGYRPEVFAALIVVVNLLFWLARRLQRITDSWQLIGQELITQIKGFSLQERWAIVCFAAVMGLLILINPYAQNADNYLTIVGDSISHHTNLLLSRQSFVNWLTFLHFGLFFDYVKLYVLFFPVAFFVSSLAVPLYLRGRVPPRLIALAYLSPLIATVILSEVNIIRPQLGMIIFTLPIIFLLVEAWRSHRPILTALAGIMALSAVTFHELALPLLLLCLGVAVAELAYQTAKGVVKPRYYLIAIIIVLPYLVVLPFDRLFSSSSILAKYFASITPHLQWRWWFINSYTTPDGFNLGWPGILSLLYYLYNGLLFLIAVIWLWTRLKTKRLRKAIGSWWVPGSYILVYLVIAELLPRLGINFFPNRAWVHLMLGVVVLFALMIERYAVAKQKISRPLYVLLLAALALGVVGSLYVAFNNVSVVYREEAGLIHYLRANTPTESLVISSQDNRTLVVNYAHRPYVQLAVQSLLDKSGFDKATAELLGDSSTTAVRVIRPEIVENVEVVTDGKVTATFQRLLQSSFTVSYPAVYHEGTPVYLIYSSRKYQGINRWRTYLASSGDQINEQTYPTFGYDVVYRDSTGYILRLR